MVNKKGQLKIQQMIFMLIAVTFLFILVGIFFLAISLYNLKKAATNLEEKNAMLLVSKLANSPEFSCGNAFGSKKGDCIDFGKLMALRYRTEKYADFWGGIAKIEIRKIYPDEGSVICNEKNYPDCGIIKIVDKNVNSTPYASNFVSLCRKESDKINTYDKCELARLLVSSEVKG